jgi:hypothetical protein
MEISYFSSIHYQLRTVDSCIQAKLKLYVNLASNAKVFRELASIRYLVGKLVKWTFLVIL